MIFAYSEDKSAKSSYYLKKQKNPKSGLYAAVRFPAVRAVLLYHGSRCVTMKISVILGLLCTLRYNPLHVII